MNKFVVAALLAASPATVTSAEASVTISFTGTSDADNSPFFGSVTINSGTVGPNRVPAPDTLYKGSSLLTLTLGGSSALAGTPSVSLIYSNATGRDPSVDPEGDFNYGAAFGQQNDDGTSDGSYFNLYNNDYSNTPSAIFDNILIPDLRSVPNVYFSYSSGGVDLFGFVKITGYAVSNSVPEPASWAMMIAGFGMIGGMMRRRRVMFAPA